MTNPLTLSPISKRLPITTRKIATAFAVSVLMTGCTTLQPSANTSAKAAYDPTDRIEDHIYVGIGMGLSHLNPDASESSTYDVNDRVQNAGLLNVGMDLSRQVAIDLQAVNLGSAGFSPEGSIDYKEYSASALLYMGKNRHRYKRRGLSAYGRFGAGYLQNKTNGVPYQKDNGVHLLVGFGAEYMTQKGLGLRAEFISYEEDINYGQLGLIYRFGQQDERKPIETVAAPVEPVVPPIVATPVVEPVVEAALPETNRCLELTGVLDGVNFHSDSDKLTNESISVLSGLADTLRECDSTSITVSAHTDSQGPEAYNENLSQRRAVSVVNFLDGRGIDTNRLNSQAFGERLPIDTNDTAEGRANNRRVELLINE